MTDPLFDVREKVCVVTGAGGALCGVMARELAARGARVALLDIDLPAAERGAAGIGAAGGQAIALRCDVLDEAGVSDCLASITARWGIPEVLINGAGGNHPSGSTTATAATPDLLARWPRDARSPAPSAGTQPAKDATPPVEPAAGETLANDPATFFDLPIAGFERVFDLNFLGTVIPSRIVGAAMASRGRGSIINLSSMSALTPLTKVGAYSAAKAAVANITKWLAVHLAPVGIRVNALAPGFFMTEQLKFLHIDQKTGEYTLRAKAAIAHTPMGRYGEPEDLVGAVIWLASAGSSFVTGLVLPIDGGFSSYTI